MDRLEDLVENRTQVLNKAWGVDVQEFFVLTSKIRASLPDDMKKANRLVKDAERILDEARAEAEQLMERTRREAERLLIDARSQAEKLLDSDEITKLATVKGRETLAQAEQQAAEMRRGADQYALEVLGKLENYVAGVMHQVQRGRERLERVEKSDGRG